MSLNDELKNLASNAALDQAIEGTKNMAKILATYRTFLLKEGFSQIESMQLILEFQRSMLESIRRHRPKS